MAVATLIRRPRAVLQAEVLGLGLVATIAVRTKSTFTTRATTSTTATAATA
jgi:hypothetical protein